MDPNEELAFIVKVLQQFDYEDGLLWSVKDGHAKFSVICNDVFWWGSADAEDLTPDNVDELKRAREDVMSAKGRDQGSSEAEWRYEAYAKELFCARVRKMRPQGAAYPKDPKMWSLFDACGPEREIDILNPIPHPSKK